jgi:integrase
MPAQHPPVTLSILLAALVVVVLTWHPWSDDHADVELAGVATTATIWRRYRYYLQVDCERAPRTVKAYRFILWDWFGFLHPRLWHKARQQDLRRFLERPTRSGRAHGDRLSPNTRLHYAATVCGFYGWAHASRNLPRDPMAAFKLPLGGVPVPRSFPLTDVETILSAAEHDSRLYVMCALAYYAGLRCAEIAAVRIEHLVLHDGPPRLLVHRKGGKRQTLPLHPQLVTAITRVLVAAGWPRVGPLVTSRRRPGEPMTPGSVSRALSDHIRSVGVDGSGHGLRHTVATGALAAEHGRNLDQVAAFLGHADSRTTRRYVLAYDWELDELVPKIPDPRRPSRR